MADDVDEGSAAMLGSVGEPVAFAVMQPDSYVVVHTRHAAVVRREMCGGGEIVPLYRLQQPTLADAEREAIGQSISRLLDAEYYGGPEPASVVTLRGLLERLK